MEREKAGVTFGVPVTASFYKNVGIAYSRIVQSKVDVRVWSFKMGST